MANEKLAIIAEIKGQICKLAEQLGEDASSLSESDVIPAMGVIDSAALLELMSWYEERYEIEIAQEELTIDNFGTLELMADYVLARRASG